MTLDRVREVCPTVDPDWKVRRVRTPSPVSGFAALLSCAAMMNEFGPAVGGGTGGKLEVKSEGAVPVPPDLRKKFVGSQLNQVRIPSPSSLKFIVNW